MRLDTRRVLVRRVPLTLDDAGLGKYFEKRVGEVAALIDLHRSIGGWGRWSWEITPQSASP